MVIFAQICNSIIFLAIAGLHFYWAIVAFFGRKIVGSSSVLPEINGKPLFVPSAFATLVVALGLLLFAVISSFGLFGFLSFNHFSPVIKYGNLAIAIIFFVRAIGDFKYVGFFKKEQASVSNFAKNDTKYYSPLCLFIAVMAIIIYLYQ